MIRRTIKAPNTIIVVRFMSVPSSRSPQGDFPVFLTRASEFFALTDAAGLESRLLVALSAISTRLAPSLVYARSHEETPHPPPTNFWYKNGRESTAGS